MEMLLSTRTVRWFMLSLLVFQTSLTVLLFRYTRTTGEPYVGSTVVLLTECCKYALSLLLLWGQAGGSMSRATDTFILEIINKPRETAVLCVPALLYTVQNNLLIIALTNLDAATYQITYQLKVLTTAGFSVILLQRQLTKGNWLSLLILAVGVALVQIPRPTESDALEASPTRSSSSLSNRWLGLMAVLTASFSSGFAGVFYEKLVKHSNQRSLVIRNLQLGLFSILFAFFGVVFCDGATILEKGLFHGYTMMVILVVLLQSVGGLVVAATIKYADNILKGYATSISILVSTLLAWLLHDLQPGPHFLAGTLLVTVSTVLYCSTQQASPTQTANHAQDKRTFIA